MATAQQIIALTRDYSIETTPGTAAKVESFKALLPAGTCVNVTFLPGTDYNDTVATARRLKDDGMVPVPHIAARSIPTQAALETYLGRLRDEAGVTQALVIGGGLKKPLGLFDATIQLLETGLFEKYGIRKIGIAGHPEGTPDIAPDEVKRHTLAKARWAADRGLSMYLVTQFCFEVDPVMAWMKWLSDNGMVLPVRIGVPGPASIKTLLRFAQECGIGPSMRVITRQAANIAKLLTVQTPDELMAALAEFKAKDTAGRLDGIHLYPFGGFAKTCAWFNRVAAGHFALDRSGTGFSLVEAAAAS
jgi:methylenetetrahydrofolate reductase (NADPH)